MALIRWKREGCVREFRDEKIVFIYLLVLGRKLKLGILTVLGRVTVHKQIVTALHRAGHQWPGPLDL